MAVATPIGELGLAAPDFALPGVDGNVWTCAAVTGDNGLLVMFICNHCPYVKAIRERLVRAAADVMALGVGVVAINANDAQAYPEDDFETMQAVAAQFGFPFPYLQDASQAVARAYDAVCTPDFFGYNRDMQLQYRGRLDAGRLDPPPEGARRELVEAMRQIAETGRGPAEQTPSMGCSIKWLDAG